jgi:hypothetical protein
MTIAVRGSEDHGAPGMTIAVMEAAMADPGAEC